MISSILWRIGELALTGVAGLVALVVAIMVVCWLGAQIGSLLEPLVTSAAARRNAWATIKVLGVLAFWGCVVVGVLMLIGMLIETVLGAPAAQAIPELARKA